MSGSFPSGLGAAFDRLSGFTKQIDIVYPDRKDAVSQQSRIRVKLNSNSLVNLRSLKMYYQFTVPEAGLTSGAAAVTGTPGVPAIPAAHVGRYHPRYSSSIINDISLYFNNNLISSINEYNLLYNTLGDLTIGQNQTAKRYLENLDPSVKYTSTALAGNLDENIELKRTTNQYADNISDTNRPFVINNFINFLGNSSTEFLNTNITGDFELSITLASASIVWQAYEAGTAGGGYALAAVAPAPSYTLNNIYFTYERVILNDPLYDNLISSQINSPEGLKIQFTEYSTHIGPLQGREINYSFNTSATSLDNIICTTRRADYQTVGPLLLQGGDTAVSYTYINALNNGLNCFNQSSYFRRDMLSLGTSQIEINGTQMYKRPLTKYEVYQETLNALNPSDDIVHNVHPGLNSIFAFLKYYFTHILSLNYNGETKVPTISGLDGKGSSFNILWKTTIGENFGAVTYAQVYPVVFCAKSQVLQINAGQQHAIMP